MAVLVRAIIDPMILETFACREALALADDLNIQRVMVALDSLGVVKDINSGTRGPHSAIVHEITEWSNSFILCSFVHERRNHNFKAHNLAKSACKLGLGRHVWLGTPHAPTVYR